MIKSNTDPLVYLLILNYCSLDDTLLCVEHIKQSTYKNYKIIVIDNDSPDSSGRILSSQLPAEEFMQLKKNTGYAGGNNIGTRIALENAADYVLIINPDIRLEADAISQYVTIFQTNEGVGALNPIQLTPDGESVDRRFSWMVYGKHLSINEISTDKYEIFTSDILLGASLMLSRDALEKVGGFDPLYFAYGEELDLCRRLRYHGIKLVVTNKSPVIHLRTHENSGTSDFVLFLRLKGIYLNELKDPNRSFFSSIISVLKRFQADMKNGNATYAHPFRKTHYFKVASWIILNMPKIYFHLRAEKRGNAHLL